MCVGDGRQKHIRAFPPHWYTRRGSHNREVTRVKKDVRVNLARCISGDELIPPISLWFSISVIFSFRFSLSLSLLSSLSRNVFPSARFASMSLSLSLSLSHISVLFFGPRLQPAHFSPPPIAKFLFIYGGLNEPWKSRLARCLLKCLELEPVSAALCDQIPKTW